MSGVPLSVGLDKVTARGYGIELSAPLGRVERSSRGTVVSGRGSSSIVFQDIGDSQYRAAIHIAKPTDPQRYEFEIKGAARLEKQFDGSVLAFDERGELFAGVKAPWARDSNGQRVATRFEVDGTRLVQIVDHHGERFAYGIVADPIPFLVLTGTRLALLTTRCYAHPVCKKIIIEEGLPKALAWAIKHIPI